QILNEVGKSSIERQRLENEIEIERLKSKRETDREDREFTAKHKIEVREARAEAARKAREAIKYRKRGVTVSGGIPPFALNCEECRALLEGRKPAHTTDMEKHAVQQHRMALEPILNTRILEASNGAPN